MNSYKVGDIVKGNEIGYKSHVKLIWVACDKCGKERFVQLVNDKPCKTTCRHCSQLGITREHTVSDAILHPITKVCTKCGKLLSANTEYFMPTPHVRCGLTSRCRNCTNEIQRAVNLRSGKTKKTKAQIKKESEIKKINREKEFIELQKNKDNIVGVSGEIRRARDVGLNNPCNVIWRACSVCGKERWFRLKFGIQVSTKCYSCSVKDAGKKRMGKKSIRNKTKDILSSGYQEGLKCHNTLPCTEIYFTKSKNNIGFKSTCRECAKEIHMVKNYHIGETEIVCELCGKKQTVLNTGGNHSIYCGGCSQKLSGKQKLPRGERDFEMPQYSICNVCGNEYPATSEYWIATKITKSGLKLGSCKKCTNKKKIMRVKSTLHGRVNRKMSKIISSSLKGGKCGRHWFDLVGYTADDLIKHIDSLFIGDMSWDNYGKWHIDHIIPQSYFKFNSPDDIGFKQCWALSNLQPLWAEDNIMKSDKILEPVQGKFIV
jgi:hypothetical protein